MAWCVRELWLGTSRVELGWKQTVRLTDRHANTDSQTDRHHVKQEDRQTHSLACKPRRAGRQTLADKQAGRQMDRQLHREGNDRDSCRVPVSAGGHCPETVICVSWEKHYSPRSAQAKTPEPPPLSSPFKGIACNQWPEISVACVAVPVTVEPAAPKSPI